MARSKTPKSIVVLYIAVIAVTLCASVLIVHFTGTVFKRMDDQLDQRHLEQLIQQRERSVQEIEKRLSLESRNVRHHAEALGLAESDQDIVKMFRRSVEGEMKTHGALSGAAFVDYTGALRAVYPETLNNLSLASDIREFFTFTSDIMGPTIGKIVEIEGIGQVLPMSYPVRRDVILKEENLVSDNLWGEETALRELNGVLTIFFSLEELVTNTLINIDPFILVDNAGNISPYGINTVSSGQIPLFKGPVGHPLDITARNLLKGFSGVERITIDGANHFVSFAPVRFPSGTVNNRESLFTSEPHFFTGIGLLHREDILAKSDMARRNINLVVGAYTLVFSGFLTLIASIIWLRLSERNRTYKAQLKAVKETAGSAAHHISQPLTAINGYIKMIDVLSGSLPAEQAGKVGELVQKVMSASYKIQAIVEDMNDLPGYRTEEYLKDMQITILENRQDKNSHAKR